MSPRVSGWEPTSTPVSRPYTQTARRGAESTSQEIRQAQFSLLTLLSSKTPYAITLRLPDTSLVPLVPEPKTDADGDTEMSVEQEPAGGSSSTNTSKLINRHRLPRYDTSGIPDEYDVDVPAERAKNLWVFSERVRTWAEMGSSRDGALKKRKRENGE